MDCFVALWAPRHDGGVSSLLAMTGWVGEDGVYRRFSLTTSIFSIT
jgi:hypothetical protein